MICVPVFTFTLRAHEDDSRIRWSVFDRTQPVLLSNGNRVPAEVITCGDDIEVAGVRYEVVG